MNHYKGVKCSVCKKPIGQLPGLAAKQQEFVCRDCWKNKKPEVITGIGGVQIRVEHLGRFVEPPAAEPGPDTPCAHCGFTLKEHSYQGSCIERLPDHMRQFSKTERFRQ